MSDLAISVSSFLDTWIKIEIFTGIIHKIRWSVNDLIEKFPEVPPHVTRAAWC
jgi:hypothetical protein